MKSKVFVTRKALDKIAPDDYREMEKECELEVFPESRIIEKNELMSGVKDKDGVLISVGDPYLDRDIIEAGSKLKTIASIGVAFSHIDTETATEKGIYVSNTPSQDIASAVAEATWALLLAVTKRIVEGDRDVRAGRFLGWGPADYIGADIPQGTLGIVGFGRIGKMVAKMAMGWDMKILYADEIPASPDAERELKAERVPLEQLLKESDFVTLHCPLIPGKTFHLIGEKELSLMKPGAYLVNVARGPVVDEKALAKHLKDRKIAGAALDVFENEPALSEGLAELDNVVLTPHLASATWRARRSYVSLAIQNLLAALRGEVPPNLVNEDLKK
ncbi:MAG: D-glycerate dehydrogenase [Dehalococcoidales bacterium]